MTRRAMAVRPIAAKRGFRGSYQPVFIRSFISAGCTLAGAVAVAAPAIWSRGTGATGGCVVGVAAGDVQGLLGWSLATSFFVGCAMPTSVARGRLETATCGAFGFSKSGTAVVRK